MINQGTLSNELSSLKLSLNDAKKNTDQMIEVLNQFASYAAENSIQVFLVYPATSKITDPATLEFIKQLDERLRRELVVPILGTVAESEFSDQYMFNTYYHLNSVGAVIHTNQVILWLCNEDKELVCQ